MRSFIRTHKIVVGAAAAAVLAGIAWLAFGFFGVHTLFIDDVVDEAGPVFDVAPVAADAALGDDDSIASAASTSAPAVDPAVDPASDRPTDTVEPASDLATTTVAPQQPAPPAIATEFVGTFRGDAHPTAGIASVLGNGTGQRFLRLQDFETDNGPDLNVYLVNSSTGDVSDFVDLGDLKGNIGDQNYEIPEGVDLSVYDQVVIWCVRFGVGFGDALLTPA
jgi:hypothetical protein